MLYLPVVYGNYILGACEFDAQRWDKIGRTGEVNEAFWILPENNVLKDNLACSDIEFKPSGKQYHDNGVWPALTFEEGNRIWDENVIYPVKGTSAF